MKIKNTVGFNNYINNIDKTKDLREENCVALFLIAKGWKESTAERWSERGILHWAPIRHFLSEKGCLLVKEHNEEEVFNNINHNLIPLSVSINEIYSKILNPHQIEGKQVFTVEHDPMTQSLMMIKANQEGLSNLLANTPPHSVVRNLRNFLGRLKSENLSSIDIGNPEVIENIRLLCEISNGNYSSLNAPQQYPQNPQNPQPVANVQVNANSSDIPAILDAGYQAVFEHHDIVNDELVSKQSGALTGVTVNKVKGLFEEFKKFGPGTVKIWKDEHGNPAYLVKKLGAGTFGKAYLFVNLKLGEVGVFKDAKRKGLVPLQQTKTDLANEYNILQKIHAKGKVWGIQAKLYKLEALNITTKHDTPKERYGILGQNYDGDYFNDILKSNSTLDDRLADFHQLLFGLKELAARGILHGDIKPENVFLNTSGGSRRVYIADMGGAVSSDKNVWNLRDLVAGAGKRAASPNYTTSDDLDLSVELASLGKRDELVELEKKRDVFAMGSVLFSALTGFLPFKYFYHSGFPDTYLGFPDEMIMAVKGVPPELKQLIERMLNLDHTARPTAEEAFQEFIGILNRTNPALARNIDLAMKQEGYV